ncbi:MAG: transglutaminase domain-containing protein [Elusimicrobiota bacterium]
MMRVICPAVGCLLSLLAVLFVAGASGTLPPPGPRRMELVETVRVDGGGGELRVWMPIPRSNPEQRVELLGVESPIPWRRTREKEFGNELLYFEARRPGAAVLRARYRITRTEQAPAAEAQPPLSRKERELFTTPRGLAVVDEEVRRLAREAGRGSQDPLESGRRLYDAVLSLMSYDKSEPGWGEGDTRRACRVGKGNCTDFHSLFLSLAMARGLPARFLMGVPVSDSPAQELGRDYHCWAEFYAAPLGWVPVDISQAWKTGKKESFFGSLDDRRILFTVGRGLLLEPAQRGPRLNYFAYPHVEIDGRPDPGYGLERSVKTQGS